jgi:hypothetical protein
MIFSQALPQSSATSGRRGVERDAASCYDSSYITKIDTIEVHSSLCAIVNVEARWNEV